MLLQTILIVFHVLETFTSKIHYCCNLHWSFGHVFKFWAWNFNVVEACSSCMNMFLKLSLQTSIVAIVCTSLLDMFLKLWAWNFNVVKAYFGCMDMFMKLSPWSSIIVVACTGFLNMFSLLKNLVFFTNV
jgi:chromate transport protein ChrA